LPAAVPTPTCPGNYARVADRRGAIGGGCHGDRDGLPNVVLEAMASGRAVVASDIGATASAIVSGRTGLLVPRGRAGADPCA